MKTKNILVSVIGVSALLIFFSGCTTISPTTAKANVSDTPCPHCAKEIVELDDSEDDGYGTVSYLVHKCDGCSNAVTAHIFGGDFFKHKCVYCDRSSNYCDQEHLKMEDYAG